MSFFSFIITSCDDIFSHCSRNFPFLQSHARSRKTSSLEIGPCHRAKMAFTLRRFVIESYWCISVWLFDKAIISNKKCKYQARWRFVRDEYDWKMRIDVLKRGAEAGRRLGSLMNSIRNFIYLSLKLISRDALSKWLISKMLNSIQLSFEINGIIRLANQKAFLINFNFIDCCNVLLNRSRFYFLEI